MPSIQIIIPFILRETGTFIKYFIKKIDKLKVQEEIDGTLELVVKIITNMFDCLQSLNLLMNHVKNERISMAAKNIPKLSEAIENCYLKSNAFLNQNNFTIETKIKDLEEVNSDVDSDESENKDKEEVNNEEKKHRWGQ